MATENTAGPAGRTEADAIIEAAQAAVEVQVLAGLNVAAPHTLVTAGPEGVEISVSDLESYAARPRRKANAVTLADTDSFVAYVQRHKADGTTIYADRDHARVVAVLNDHEPDAPGWGDHRATLQFAVTPEWLRWTANDGKMLSQQAFAAHIEASLAEILEPKAATMLELAETMSGDVAVKWKAGGRLQDGSRQLQFEETVTTRAGATGDIKIPEQFVLALLPYEGLDGDPYRLTARFRYRINQGALTLGYVLVRPLDVLDEAFGGVVEAVTKETGVPVLLGRYE